MAYAPVVICRALGAGRFEVEISEPAALATTSEAEIPTSDDGGNNTIPTRGRILSQKCTLVSGSAASIDPILGEVANPAGTPDRVVAENATPAANVYNQAVPPIPYNAGGGGNKLFHRSVPDSAADNVARTVYQVLAGWE
jgi:hypothetical protein